ncbi:ABC transporter ATP-binding protein [Pseudochelatococcus contaminans]|uniref:ABC-type glutathione transport system ATPase component n=1 Tax=Pseudochelatococcus contaminans TaxID=1538103 RepID=A0A7W5Z5J3_9HYPH|nr:ABC-type glutathione transport system ATPase component [Pseudochelatococcus contaminans]
MSTQAIPNSPAGKEPVLRYRNASVVLPRPRGGDLPLIRGVDLDVYRNEIVALVGESGSGKTMTALSTLRLLPQNARFSADEAVLNGHDLRSLNARGWRALRGSHVGIVFQEPLSSLNPVLTIGDQIGEVLYHKRGLSRRQRRAEATDLLARMGLARPAQLLDEYPFQLSGGMRQRVMLAIAMAGEPALLIADEPTTALDNSVQAQVLELIVSTAADTGVGVLMITHDLSVVAQVADRVAVMRHGEMVETGDVREVFRAPKAAYTRHLIDLAPRIPAVVRDPATAQTPPAADAAAGTPLLELRNVTKHYVQPGNFWGSRTTLALDNVSLSLAEGKTLGLVGESGSGKSSLARIIIGLSKPDSGAVLFDGRDLFGPEQARRSDVQIVFQDPLSSLNPRMRIVDIVTEPLGEKQRLTRDQRRHEAETLLETVGLPRHMISRFPHELSGGQRQRVGIARALSVRPRLLICDEPVSALDVSVQAEIIALLQRLREEFRLTTIFIAHGLDSVYAVSDDIVVLEKGRVVEHGHRDTVFGSPQHPYTRKLIDAILDSDPDNSRFKRDKADYPQAARVSTQLEQTSPII